MTAISSSYVCHEPYGQVLILSPWNYPINLTFIPLVGAMAGGNTVIVKSSKSSYYTSLVIKKIINETFKPEYIKCINDEFSYDEILDAKYDLIFFTGSMNVGKTVMEKASKHLTPVILELGGKSPCIVEKSADVKLACKRIIWGKLINAGQTCVAPDYVLIDSSIKQEFIEEAKKNIATFYPNIVENKDYPKIINQHHFQRLMTLINNEPNKIFIGSNETERKIALTLFTSATFDDEVMKDEIFGPILPIIAYDDLDQVINKINQMNHPLAFYLFSNNKTLVNDIINKINFGGGCINNVVLHIANNNIPFGGVGTSGMGNYHGINSLKAFTREKSVLDTKLWFDNSLKYPPFTEKKYRFIRKIFK